MRKSNCKEKVENKKARKYLKAGGEGLKTKEKEGQGLWEGSKEKEGKEI